jgi:hypothetical protein
MPAVEILMSSRQATIRAPGGYDRVYEVVFLNGAVHPDVVCSNVFLQFRHWEGFENALAGCSDGEKIDAERADRFIVIAVLAWH